MKLIRVNTADGTIAEEALPAERAHYGGRLLTSTIVAEEVPPLAHPLGPRNKLIVANGLLAGHANAPCSGRMSVGCKSPLTGTIKEANTGGDAGCYLGRHGIRGIVFEALPAAGEWRLIRVSEDGIELIPADPYVGLNNYDLVDAVRRDMGEKVSVVCIGTAGEQRLSAASVAVTSVDGAPSRHAGRGGTGAVMGAKGIKAIVVDMKPGRGIPIADAEEFKRLCGEFARELHESKQILRDYGTANLVNPISELGGLATRNFSAGTFEGAEKISGETMREIIDERGGAHGRACMPGCPIRSANRYVCADGTVVDDVEFESIALLGSNCGIDDLDALAKLERLCDDLGLDTIDTGGAIGVAMEAGLLEFGDGEKAIELLSEVGKGSAIGKIIGSGAAITARVLGVRRVPAVKGQGFPAYDPRGLKGMGVTYATTPMGADHTAGAAIPNRPGIGELNLDTMDKQDKDLLSYDLQIMTGVLDALGVCMFMGPQVSTTEWWAKIVSAATGEKWTPKRLLQMAHDMIRMEIDFNRRAGFSEQHDRLPEHLYSEPLPPKGPVFDIDDATLDEVAGSLTVDDRVPDDE
jgi:aldehyde:ferredoxin oxidoreductase